MKAKIGSLVAERAIKTLGDNIRTARLKRRIAIKDFAERVGASESTVMRLEKGDDGVSIGTIAMALLVLGEIDRLSDLLDPGSDDTGLLLEREALPKRIDRKRSASPLATNKSWPASAEDDDGVGF